MAHLATSRRLLATTLATLAFWTPVAATVARAQDLEGAIPEPSAGEEVRQAVVEHGLALEPGANAADVLGEELAEEGKLDFDAVTEGEEVEGEEPETKQEAGPVTPLALPSGPAKTAVTPQQISLPKGEGSIEGMGESFTPNLSSGTGTFAVPIALPAGRNGVNPSLSLSYSTSGGSGIAGIGWGLGAPFISRQTDKGLPRYRDAAQWSAGEDRFMYNGGQELVPVENADMSDGAAPIPAELSDFQQYRARVEGAFMRFFRSPDLSRWVVQSKDGTRFDFGRLPAGSGANLGEPSLQADPEDSRRIFAWYLTRMSDVHGSTVQYVYKQDQGQVYLTDLYYDSPASCAFATVVARRNCAAAMEQYGRHVRLVYEGRQDVTESYSTTWRIETNQRLKRIEITSAMGTVGSRSLVRRYHLSYAPGSFHSLLTTVQVEGRKSRYDATLGVNVADMISESALGDAVVGDLLPPMRFGYTEPNATSESIPGFGGIDTTVKTSAASPDRSVDEARSDLFDVNADGLPDLLVTDPARYADGAGVYFNGFSASGRPFQPGAFSEGVRVGIPPGLSGTMTLSSLNIVPMDIDGDGKSDLLHMPRQQNYGYFVTSKTPMTSRYNPVEGWSFEHIKTALPTGVTDPRIDLGKDTDYLKTLDVNNDHLIDVIKSSGQHIQTWLNLGWLPGGDGRFGSYSETAGLSTEPVESCLPFAGRNLDLSDPGVRIADMNGDGLQDIVQLSFGSVVYFPGRGEGAWGVGAHECEDSNRRSRHVTMQDPPRELSTELAGVQLADVNADGATDLVQLSVDTMSVWFNRAGMGWTDRIVVDGLPFASEAPERTRIADIDGTGTIDIIYARAKKWQWVDPMGGQRPRLLETVDNGLGALTTLSYSTSVEDYLRDLAGSEFDWNTEPLAPGSKISKCDAKAEARGAGCVHRGGGSPVVSTVVRAVTTTDRMSALGVADSITRTEYRYHDAYYEGIEQEFRGFGAAEAIAIGDTHGPTSITRTYFHQGKRPNAIAADRLADNPNEALKGREYLTENYDQKANYLSTSHATYAVRSLGTGLDGTDISYAYVKRSDELKYDTAAPSLGSSGSLTLDAVVRERAGADTWSVLSAPAQDGDAPHEVPIRNPKYVRIANTIDRVDNVGNVAEQTALGRVDKSEAILSYNIADRIDDTNCDNTGWLWRTSQSWTTDPNDQTVRFDWNLSAFTDCGDQWISAQQANVPAATGTFAFGGTANAAGYEQPSEQYIVSSSTYDAWGQTLESCAGDDQTGVLGWVTAESCMRYSSVQRDAAYGMFAERESTATGIAANGLNLLTVSATWDAGLGVVTQVTDPNGLVSEVLYDGLGRTTGMIAPNVKGCEGKRVPTTRIFYDLTTSPGSRPLSRVHTITELNCTAIGTDMLEAYAYVDGLGRPRAALAEGDPDPGAWSDNRGHAWVRSGLTVFNAKGQRAIAYQPDFFELSPQQYEDVLGNPQQSFSEAFSDAFGRPVEQYAEDRSLSSTVYHELSVVASDGVDNDVGHRHYKTSTVTFQDGHGRTIGQRLHQRHAVGGSDEFHFLFSYYRPDGAVARVIRALAPENTLRPDSGYAGLTSWVERSFVYDTVGRRIASFDPDTDNRAGAINSKTWRYLFNSVGDLAAVRDPRGCGQNFFYDRAGRLIGEQYVSCDEAQANVEALAGAIPEGSIGLGVTTAQNVHALYHFDAYPGWIGGALPSVRSGVLGRATGVTDRGQRSVVAYDDRGNPVWGARQVALPAQAGTYAANGVQSGFVPVFNEGAESARPNAFDALHTYVRTATFDHAGRGLTAVLPTDPDFNAGTAPVVGGSMQYNAAGKPRRANLKVDAATYPLVQNLRYERDGLVGETTYGDGMNSGRPSTVSLTEYDVRRRPMRLTTLRSPRAGSAPQTLSAVSIVVDQRLEWDRASNLTDIHDQRPGGEWPASHRPQSVQVLQDALYHVEHALFTYTDANNVLQPMLPDAASDWRDTEQDHRVADPMHSKAAPRMGSLPSTRVMNLNYEYDWLANMVSWDDDAHSFYERSIGDIVNGNKLSANAVTPTYRPSALYLASNLDPTTPSDRGGYLDLDYGVGGNVVSMTVHAQCVNKAPNVCLDPGGSDPVVRRDAIRSRCTCASEQHYSYRYDELNRMSEARRFDRESGLWSLKARQRYRYDSANLRTVKETSDIASNDTRATLYVVPGDFERRGLRATANSYAAIAAETETQYVVAGARVVWQDRDALTPTQLDADHRITFAVGDLIQSTSAVVDLMSGELLEVTGFYPNGAREHWLDSSLENASSMPLETKGFTGKEADEEVGLTYFGERYLIQRIGRWATPDPLAIHAMGGGEAGNAYHYVSGNLLAGRDPLGLEDAKSVKGASEQVRQAGGADGASQARADFYNSQGWSPDHPMWIANGTVGETSRGFGDWDADAKSWRAFRSYDDSALLNMSGEQLDGYLSGYGEAYAREADRLETWNKVLEFSSELILMLSGARTAREPKTGGAKKPPACPTCPCFVAGTPVLMADGATLPIEQVREGDLVLADDPGDSEPPSAARVTQVIRSTAEVLVDLSWADAAGRLVTITTTRRHPFWTKELGWVDAAELQVGNTLVSATGSERTITALAVYPDQEQTYNLTVETSHTYFVGPAADAVLVHNQNPRLGLVDIANRVRAASPHPIPDHVQPSLEVKPGANKTSPYLQVRFKWTENGVTFDVRWHTKTPGAPEGTPPNWRVDRHTQGSPKVQNSSVHETMLRGPDGKTRWVSQQDFKDAAWRVNKGRGSAADHQMMKEAHMPEGGC